MIEELSQRTADDQVRRLEAANARLRAEVADLRQELATMKEDSLQRARMTTVSSPPADRSMEVKPGSPPGRPLGRTGIPLGVRGRQQLLGSHLDRYRLAASNLWWG